jgi:hypothetical protein
LRISASALPAIFTTLNGRTRSVLLLLTASAAAGCAWVLDHFDPARAHFYPPCVFHALTGLACPGCGGTRAMYQLLHGHLAMAWRYNPAMMLYLPVMLFGGIEVARSFLTGRDARPITLRPWLAWAIVASIVVWWIVRNTSLWPYRLASP